MDRIEHKKRAALASELASMPRAFDHAADSSEQQRPMRTPLDDLAQLADERLRREVLPPGWRS